MARLVFPDEGSRLVYQSSGAYLRTAADATATIYTDSGATILADIQTMGGEPIAGSSLAIDAYSRLPLFLGPDDDVDTLYAVVDGGPAAAVYARADDRLDSVESAADAAQTAAESGAVAASRITGTLDAARIPDLTATYARKTREACEVFPFRDVTEGARGSDPIPCGEFDGYVWGTSAVSSSATLYRSSDGGNTWAQYVTGVSCLGVGGETSGIQRLVETADGEVLAVSTGQVARSAGWAAGSPTWTVVLTNTANSYFYPWGFSGDGTKFVAVHYSSDSQGRVNSRYGWISLDGGLTWTQKWDTAARFGDSVNALTHIHAAEYDAWQDRFFICEGHDTATGVYVSEDDGDTWNRLSYGPSFDAAPTNAPTVCIATDSGIVFGSDDSHNGIYVLTRGADKIEYVWAWDGQNNSTLLGYAHQGWRDRETGIVYIVYETNTTSATDLPAPIAASDGRTANRVWYESGVFGQWRRIYVLGGKFVAWEQRSDLVAKGSLGGLGSIPGHTYDTGRTLGGSVNGGRKSVAVGREAVAVGDGSVAVGGGASTTTHDGTAVGADSAAVGSATAVGSGTHAEALGVAVGMDASATNSTSIGNAALTANAGCTAVGRGARAVTDAGGAVPDATAVGRDAKANAAGGKTVAVGQGATASATQSTALGRTSTASATFALAVGEAATASHASAVALGQGTTTTATSQLQIGGRHIELTEIASDPTAPAVNGARLFVRDNGSGKTQVCVRFNTGAVVVIATEA